jgi:hypothetical protein
MREFFQTQPFDIQLNDKPIEYNPDLFKILSLRRTLLQNSDRVITAEELSCSSHLVGQLTPPPARFTSVVHQIITQPDYAEVLPTILKLLTS